MQFLYLFTVWLRHRFSSILRFRAIRASEDAYRRL